MVMRAKAAASATHDSVTQMLFPYYASVHSEMFHVYLSVLRYADI